MTLNTHDDVVLALGALGLGEGEARLYRLLVERGPSTVGALAPAAGLSRTKAYGVLDGMVARGLAALVADRPRTYAAADPDAVLRRASEDLGSAERVVRRRLVPRFRAQEGRTRQSTLRGMAVMRRAEEMLARAKHEIVLVATFLPHDLAVPLAASLRDVRARGVRVRTVVTQALMDDRRLRALRGAVDLRVTSAPRAGMLIVDDQEVLIGSFGAEGDEEGEDEGDAGDALAASGAGQGAHARIRGIWSRDLELIKLQRLVFERLYSQGA